LTDAEVHFGVIPPEHWYQPDWIDEEKAQEGRMKLMQQNIIYGGTVDAREK
jgi:alpha 1,2-mannosyltransferase